MVGDKNKLSEQSQPMLQKVLNEVTHCQKIVNGDRTLIEAIDNFIMYDMQSLSVVENTGFKQLIHMAEPHFKVPSQLDFTNNVIPVMYNHKRVNADNMLSSIQYYSVTTDIWTAQHKVQLKGNLIPTHLLQVEYCRVKITSSFNI